MLRAMFGELMVLGFIALYTYFLLKTGTLERLSAKMYTARMG